MATSILTIQRKNEGQPKAIRQLQGYAIAIISADAIGPHIWACPSRRAPGPTPSALMQMKSNFHVTIITMLISFKILSSKGSLCKSFKAKLNSREHTQHSNVQILSVLDFNLWMAQIDY